MFLDNLIRYLQLKTDAKIWDMACGKGRHVQYLAAKGFNAYGTDISENSIDGAIKHNLNLPAAHFFVHDMRRPFRTNYFDCALNIFTSLGYFEFKRDDERVFISASQSLKANGKFVVDYLNAEKVIKNLVREETKTSDGIDFNISRKIENKTIIKTIEFNAEGKEHKYEERVKAWTLNDFNEMAQVAGLKVNDVFGAYNLNKFDSLNSDRLIMIFEK